MRPVPQSDALPVPTPPANKDLRPSSDEQMSSGEESVKSISFEDNVSVYSSASGNEPHWIMQEDLNDLPRDLYLSKQQSELLTSQLKQWKLYKADVRITSFRTHKKDFVSLFNIEKRVCYCTNVFCLFTFLGFPHNPSDWRLFIDSSSEVSRLCFCTMGINTPAFPLLT